MAASARQTARNIQRRTQRDTQGQTTVSARDTDVSDPIDDLFPHIKSKASLSSGKSSQSNEAMLGDKKPSSATQYEQHEFDIGLYVDHFQFNKFKTLTTYEEKRRFAARFSVVDVLEAIKELSREVGDLNVQYVYITEFLERSDPKMLMGLKQRFDNIAMTRGLSIIAEPTYGTKNLRTSNVSVRTEGSVMSTVSGMQREKMQEFELNERAKVDMVEKTAGIVRKRCEEIEAKALQKLKALRAETSALALQREDLDQVYKNFVLHFLRDPDDIEFLEIATESKIERKLRKFMAHWFKSARALQNTLRMLNSTTKDTIIQMGTQLVIKSDMALLTPADFQVMSLKRDELETVLKEKMTNLHGLKKVSGTASMAMNDTKQVMESFEDELRRTQSRINEIDEKNTRLRKEIRHVRLDNKQRKMQLAALKDKIAKNEAPSIYAYMDRKTELQQLEKEEKMLVRKINIVEMKLTNKMNQVKKRRRQQQND